MFKNNSPLILVICCLPSVCNIKNPHAKFQSQNPNSKYLAYGIDWKFGIRILKFIT